MTDQIVFYNDSASAWEKALYAFLGERRRGWRSRDPRPRRRGLVREEALGEIVPGAR